jgi:hypothetical protein
MSPGKVHPERWAIPPAGWLLTGWLCGAAARRASLHTGVSNAEAYGSLPGDDLLPHPRVEWTRGITVQAEPEQIWPWLFQMGYGRGGWYTPEWVDLFANRWVFGVRSPFPKSADRLLPEYQQVAVGDLICDGPDYASYLRIEHVEAPHALVYRSIRHPRRGSPIDITDPTSPERVERQLRAGGIYVDFSWALVLNRRGSRTRLLLRTRADYAPPSIGLLTTMLGLFDATYGVAMLRAIARRAERRETGRRPTRRFPPRGRSLPHGKEGSRSRTVADEVGPAHPRADPQGGALLGEGSGQA